MNSLGCILLFSNTSQANTTSQLRELLKDVQAVATRLEHGKLANKELTFSANFLRDCASYLGAIADDIDPVAQPHGVIDPTDPNFQALTLALRLVQSPKTPLCSLGPFYGSGVYALYYAGPLAVYRAISGTETPIYVGKADPNKMSNTPREQGQRLHARLLEHRKNLEKVGLQTEHFFCRYLPLGDGSQVSVEKVLINFFKPVWNSEGGVLYGFGKHGDSPNTRANTRSPWDTMHPGRSWAEKSVPGKSVEEITIEVRHYLQGNRIYRTTGEIVEGLQF